jgi:SAM-dependent methyltransferase
MSIGSVPMFLSETPTIPSPMQQLLSTYAHIPTNEQSAHVLTIRDRAYALHKYPCLGRFRFLDLDMSTHPRYGDVVDLFRTSLAGSSGDGEGESGKKSEAAREVEAPVFLDLGCCLGQDIRKLLFDVSISLPPPKHLVERAFGADLLPEFIDAGYGLFRDEDTFPRKQFITPVDVFDTSERNALSVLDGRVSMLHVGAVFHLFDLEKQRDVARRCLRLLRREGVGAASEADGGSGKWKKRALMLGEQVGNITAGSTGRQDGGLRYRHSEQSWKEMWDEIIAEDEWKGVVKGVEVESRMEARSEASKERDRLKDGGKTQEENEEEMKKFIGAIEQGFQWQLWWVWVDFK